MRLTSRVPEIVTATTEGVRVDVLATYLPEQSDLKLDRYVFAYQITISNESEDSVQLLRRHWFITEAGGSVREVEGEGVVGEQPVIEPGQSHEYTSGAVLEMPEGSMRGSYLMQRTDGSSFDARIPEFKLDMPRTLH